MQKPKRFNSVSVGLLIIALVTAYLGYAFLPVFWPLIRVSGSMRRACAKAYSSTDDEKLVKDLVQDSARSGLPLTKDNFRLVREPYSDEELQIADQAMVQRMIEKGRTCRMDFRYAATYKLPILGIEYYLPYENSVRFDLRDSKSSAEANKIYDLMYNQCSCTTVRSRG